PYATLFRSTSGVLGFVGAAAHQRPCGLVVVVAGRVDDGDVQAGLLAPELGGDGGPAGAGTDDHHGVLADGCVAHEGLEWVGWSLGQGALRHDAIILGSGLRRENDRWAMSL